MLEWFAGYKPLSDLVSYLWSRKRRTTEAQRVQLKAKWKSEVEEKLDDWAHRKLRNDVVIRDVKRAEQYPGGLPGKGISPWFRVGLVSTYHGGIMLGLQWGTAKFDEQAESWRFAAFGEEGTSVLLVGYVPYHRIEWIDWKGDEFYPYTHLYLHFDGPKRTPYERLALCERRELNGRDHYTELVEYGAAKKLGSKHGAKQFA